MAVKWLYIELIKNIKRPLPINEPAVPDPGTWPQNQVTLKGGKNE